MPTAPYYLEDGTRVPSVTTVGGRFKESGALIDWAYKQGYEHGRLGLPPNRFQKLSEAGAIGTAVHDMVEGFLNGLDAHESIKLKALPDEHRTQAIISFNAFYRWQENFGLKVIEQEIHLVSEKYQFGGTPDLVARVGNHICLLDWKTSGAIYESYLVQIAAYKELWNENRPDQMIDGDIHLLRFSKEYGDFTHKSFAELDVGWEQFQLFRKAYNNDAKLKARAK